MKKWHQDICKRVTGWRANKRVEIKANMGRPGGFLSNEMSTRRLQTKTISVSPPVVLPVSSLVPLKRLDRVHRLVDDEESDVVSMNSIRNQAHTKKYVSSELETDQGEGITQKLTCTTKQLNDRIHLHTSRVSNEFHKLPFTPEQNKT